MKLFTITYTSAGFPKFDRVRAVTEQAAIDYHKSAHPYHEDVKVVSSKQSEVI